MKRLLTIAAAFFAVCAAVYADTSYLLFQGPFGSGGAEETFKFQVTYSTGSLVTGQDLLNYILGTPASNGTYTDAYGTPYPYFTSTNGANGAGYLDFSYGAGASLFAQSFTLNGTSVAMDPSYDPGWNYYVAGGSGSGNGGAYDNDGSWVFSNDGSDTRQIADGSFDGWVFGASGANGENPAMITGDDNAPDADNFAAVPEAESLVPVFVAMAGVWTLMRRRR